MSVVPPNGTQEFKTHTDDLEELIGAELQGRPDASGNLASYILERRLGGGGQASIFLAKRTVAGAADAAVVKIWRPSFVHAQPAIAGLVLTKESVALARLGDRIPPTPYVVRLIGSGEIRVRQGSTPMTLPWLALEYVHGGALGTDLGARVAESVLTLGSGFSPARARRVLRSVVEGMIAIHEVGIIHRDLKPTNILVCGVEEDELAKVADFGLARPAGLTATFGEVAVGTPGYCAPEQMDNAKVGPWSDVFSLGAVAYFVIAGEDMFQGSPMVCLGNVFNQVFPPLETRQNVDEGFRRGTILARIEAILRKATRRELNLRISSVYEFWLALDPILRDAETEGRSSRAAWVAKTLNDSVSQPWSFHVAYTPQKSMDLRTVAFDPDGHGLGAASDGLYYWEGTRWLSASAPADVDITSIRVLRRLAPQRWFACGDRGMVTIFTPHTTVAVQHILDGRFDLTAVSLVSERHFLVAGSAKDGPPVIVGFIDGVWRAPLAFPSAAAVTSLAPAGPSAWFVTGYDREGKGFFSTITFRSGEAAIEPWPIDSAALLDCAVDRQGIAFAVGAGGFAFRKGVGHPSLERVLTHRDLSVCAVDPAGTCWAAAVGRVVRRPAGGDSETWSQTWSSADWSSPFVSLGAMSGMILVAANDGSVVVGHQGLTLK